MICPAAGLAAYQIVWLATLVTDIVVWRASLWEKEGQTTQTNLIVQDNVALGFTYDAKRSRFQAVVCR
jgi:hypothetical protein